ncbi:dihydrolipoamide acetyltransferase family protein [Bacillus sp. KH172YL63]|uniref:dihydrolipoamide acetyltransferase family protein n=1 Tax=Bacillus sp. KH172YL63 TaxID=2709784 RepID=UPI0013E4AE3B|nr:dihydrolipoamide acetyltransferase family protein [Bacillus sp. KH172YL63]BCB02324.1 dihydrolipoamide acetyltransferase component of pyruvate dehydrogenase complex [Bacillus sp. KH172YL63]
MEVKLHDIGEGMTEANINHFLVKVGDVVRADQPLVEVQTDKMTAEIPAPFSGVIKEITVREGETIPVGSTVLLMEEGAGGSRRIVPASTQVVRKKRILASPYTRKIAREHGINIEEVTGSGAGGRVLDEDVFLYMKEDKGPVPEREEEAPILHEEEPHTIPFRGRRKQIAAKMSQSLRTIPHCTHFEEIDVTNLLIWKDSMKESGQSISMGAYFIKVLSVCLKEFPIFNARLNEEEECVVLQSQHHIGIAVDTDEGLIVPVIKGVQEKSMKDIHSEMKELTRKAIEGKLSMADIKGGTFTVSNVGPLDGSIGATPIINDPEVALVAFHKTKKRPMVNEKDEIVVRSMMNVSMSFDHRVADGGTAVKFTNRLRDLIEQPQSMLLELI